MILQQQRPGLFTVYHLLPQCRRSTQSWKLGRWPISGDVSGIPCTCMGAICRSISQGTMASGIPVTRSISPSRSFFGYPKAQVSTLGPQLLYHWLEVPRDATAAMLYILEGRPSSSCRVLDTRHSQTSQLRISDRERDLVPVASVLLVFLTPRVSIGTNEDAGPR